MVSMKRVDKFLHNDEVQSCIKDLKDEDADTSPGDTCLELQGCFSWGFTSNQPKKGDKEKNEKASKSAVEQETEGDSNQRKKLSKFITLKDINLQIKKGEFVCIIGDVGSGKSSLL